MESADIPLWSAVLTSRLPADPHPAQVADLVCALWQQTDKTLHPILGLRGVAALYHRSIVLTATVYPWMLAGHLGLLPALDATALRAALQQRTAAEAAAGSGALFQTFHGLLTTLVGASLTDRLLFPVWVHTPDDKPAQDPAP